VTGTPRPTDPVEVLGGVWLDDTDHTPHAWRGGDQQESFCGRTKARADLAAPTDSHGRCPMCLIGAALELGEQVARQMTATDTAEQQRGF
jgi:hypothetical protein